ncbi:hypothetical protein DENSPDRAFT_851678 [Dentipellis sp. KUC8613]|nr:hypothetical protein DENSPDRAFT_851678 [Dentipellis sp. KUC8613]
MFTLVRRAQIMFYYISIYFFNIQRGNGGARDARGTRQGHKGRGEARWGVREAREGRDEDETRAREACKGHKARERRTGGETTVREARRERDSAREVREARDGAPEGRDKAGKRRAVGETMAREACDGAPEVRAGGEMRAREAQRGVRRGRDGAREAREGRERHAGGKTRRARGAQEARWGRDEARRGRDGTREARAKGARWATGARDEGEGARGAKGARGAPGAKRGAREARRERDEARGEARQRAGGETRARACEGRERRAGGETRRSRGRWGRDGARQRARGVPGARRGQDGAREACRGRKRHTRGAKGARGRDEGGERRAGGETGATGEMRARAREGREGRERHIGGKTRGAERHAGGATARERRAGGETGRERRARRAQWARQGHQRGTGGETGARWRRQMRQTRDGGARGAREARRGHERGDEGATTAREGRQRGRERRVRAPALHLQLCSVQHMVLALLVLWVGHQWCWCWWCAMCDGGGGGGTWGWTGAREASQGRWRRKWQDGGARGAMILISRAVIRKLGKHLLVERRRPRSNHSSTGSNHSFTIDAATARGTGGRWRGSRKWHSVKTAGGCGGTKMQPRGRLCDMRARPYSMIGRPSLGRWREGAVARARGTFAHPTLQSSRAPPWWCRGLPSRRHREFSCRRHAPQLRGQGSRAAISEPAAPSCTLTGEAAKRARQWLRIERNTTLRRAKTAQRDEGTTPLESTSEREAQPNGHDTMRHCTKTVWRGADTACRNVESTQRDNGSGAKTAAARRHTGHRGAARTRASNGVHSEAWARALEDGMRVPGGSARQRCWGARVSKGRECEHMMREREGRGSSSARGWREREKRQGGHAWERDGDGERVMVKEGRRAGARQVAAREGSGREMAQRAHTGARWRRTGVTQLQMVGGRETATASGGLREWWVRETANQGCVWHRREASRASRGRETAPLRCLTAAQGTGGSECGMVQTAERRRGHRSGTRGPTCRWESSEATLLGCEAPSRGHAMAAEMAVQGPCRGTAVLWRVTAGWQCVAGARRHGGMQDAVARVQGASGVMAAQGGWRQREDVGHHREGERHGEGGYDGAMVRVTSARRKALSRGHEALWWGVSGVQKVEHGAQTAGHKDSLRGWTQEGVQGETRRWHMGATRRGYDEGHAGTKRARWHEGDMRAEKEAEVATARRARKGRDSASSATGVMGAQRRGWRRARWREWRDGRATGVTDGRRARGAWRWRRHDRREGASGCASGATAARAPRGARRRRARGREQHDGRDRREQRDGHDGHDGHATGARAERGMEVATARRAQRREQHDGCDGRAMGATAARGPRRWFIGRDSGTYGRDEGWGRVMTGRESEVSSRRQTTAAGWVQQRHRGVRWHTTAGDGVAKGARGTMAAQGVRRQCIGGKTRAWGRRPRRANAQRRDGRGGRNSGATERRVQRREQEGARARRGPRDARREAAGVTRARRCNKGGRARGEGRGTEGARMHEMATRAGEQRVVGVAEGAGSSVSGGGVHVYVYVGGAGEMAACARFERAGWEGRMRKGTPVKENNSSSRVCNGDSRIENCWPTHPIRKT